MIPVGAIAPDFRLLAQDGRPFRLADWRGRRNVLLMFLPAAFTPICSTEVPALDALFESFWGSAGTLPVALTVDNTPANLAWARACGVRRLPILSDFYPHGQVATAYGCLAPDGVAERSTAIVDRAGVVRYATVAGRFGKRNVPELLALATAIHGGRPVPATAGLLPRLDLPVLYASATCEACLRVKAFLNASGMSQRVVVRDVEGAPDVMRALLAANPEGDVPTLVLDGRVYRGDADVLAALRRRYPA